MQSKQLSNSRINALDPLREAQTTITTSRTAAKDSGRI
jgi:hypothetical protein